MRIGARIRMVVEGAPAINHQLVAKRGDALTVEATLFGRDGVNKSVPINSCRRTQLVTFR
jgi:hypothetical protein